MLKYTILDRPGAHEHVPQWRNRCTYCGHRCAVDGVEPIETRKQPWRIPAEMIGRYRAMKRGK